ncbi:MAG: xanthine dehydrogenase family protein molybdopterin-binding subunit [Terracidiphilus sp.]
MKNGGLCDKPPIRVGGQERVTGAQRYAADLQFDNLLHLKLVHLGCGHARIKSIDVSDALKVEGVQGVVTTADLPQPVPRFGPMYIDWPLLAVNETKFFGEPVAVVAADTIDAAQNGAQAVKIDFEELPAVISVEDALNPEMPLVREPELRPGDKFANTNIMKEVNGGHGNIEEAKSAFILDHAYTFPMVTHFAIEPHVFIAAPDEDGVTVWSPNQHPFVLQKVVAAALKWPLSRVRIIAPDPGGGFGGKGWPLYESLAAFLALKYKRTVRLVLTLEETFQNVRRASAQARVRTGFDAEGHLTFQEVYTDYLIGAYAAVATRVLDKGAFVAGGPYLCPHVKIRSRAILSHTTPSTAFRGFGTPQASWGVESQLTEAAARLGIDPVEIRRRNLPKYREAFVPNTTPCDGNWLEVLETAADHIGWGTPLAKHRGRGIALGVKSSSTASTSQAMARMLFDGSVLILTGTSDMGQGARTIYTQIASHDLGVPHDRIRIVMGDTSIVPFDNSTSASRSTVCMGNAISSACNDLKSKLQHLLAEELGVSVDEVEISSGGVKIPGRTMTLAEALKVCLPTRGEIIGLGAFINPPVKGHPLGGHPVFWEFNAIATELEVDPETGTVRLIKLAVVSDIGKALNQLQVEVQDEGSSIMGLGHALMEHLVHDKHGRIVNLGALDYRIPTIKDIPLVMDSVCIENGDGPGPFGSKGVGEGGLLSIAAAVGAAVNQAADVSIRDLPLTAERVWRAIQERSKYLEEPGKTLNAGLQTDMVSR